MFNEVMVAQQIAKEWGICLKVVITNTPIDVAQLTPRERAHFDTLKESPKRRPWLTGRLALKQLLAYWGDEQDTSNLSFPHAKLSLTHAGDTAVAVGTNSQALRGLGVDLELTRAPATESSRFFLSVPEQEWVIHQNDALRSQCLLRLWTVKEALFKSDPENHRRGLVDYWLVDPMALRGTALVEDNGRALGMRYMCLPLNRGFLSIAIFLKGGDDHERKTQGKRTLAS